jgi:hypothetical protein
LSVSTAYSYWIWTPKTGKWVNPKTAVKSSPKEQFEFAKGLYDIKKYEDAKREFKKLVHSYSKSTEAAESQYYLGLTEEAEGNLYEAYLASRRLLINTLFQRGFRRLSAGSIRSPRPLWQVKKERP